MKILLGVIAVWLLLSVPAGVAQEAGSRDEACPLRFGSFPAKVSSTELGQATMSARGLDSVEILSPQEEGFAVLRVEVEAPQPCYGSFRVRKRPKTTKLFLAVGFNELDWSTASETPSKTVSPVSPGLMRVRIQYISPVGQSKSGGAKICLALSPSFELQEGFSLYRFE